MYSQFAEYLRYLPAQLKLPFASDDHCVVFMPASGEGFHDWYYYLLEHPQKGIRLVRRHRILPELYPTQEIPLTESMPDDHIIIARAVWEKIANDQLLPMGDCAAK